MLNGSSISQRIGSRDHVKVGQEQNLFSSKRDQSKPRLAPSALAGKRATYSEKALQKVAVEVPLQADRNSNPYVDQALAVLPNLAGHERQRALNQSLSSASHYSSDVKDLSVLGLIEKAHKLPAHDSLDKVLAQGQRQAAGQQSGAVRDSSEVEAEILRAQAQSDFREQNKLQYKTNIKSLNRLKMQSKLSWAKRAHGAGQVTVR